MINETNRPTATHLIWARDASHGGFAYPFTSQLDSLTDLPFAAERLLGTPLYAATREHIATVFANIPATGCQIHLPFLERQELPHANFILQKTKLVQDAPTVFRLVRDDQTFEAEFFRQCLVLIAPALFPTAGVPITVTFSLERTAPAGSFIPWLPTVVEGVDGQQQLPLKMSVAYSECETRAWSNICSERTKDYVLRYGQMSVAMRRALRFWVPLLYLTEATNFTNAEWTWPLMGWAATTPQRARISRDFTYDVLDSESMSRAGRSMRRNLRQYLEPVQAGLNAIGEPMMAAHYGPSRHGKGADAAEYNRRNFNALFAGEHYLVEALLRFGVKLADLRADKKMIHSRKVRAFHRLVKEFSKAITMRLRRFFGSGSWEKLAPLLLIELTNSLAGNKQPLPIAANGVVTSTQYSDDIDLAA